MTNKSFENVMLWYRRFSVSYEHIIQLLDYVIVPTPIWQALLPPLAVITVIIKVNHHDLHHQTIIYYGHHSLCRHIISILMSCVYCISVVCIVGFLASCIVMPHTFKIYVLWVFSVYCSVWSVSPVFDLRGKGEGKAVSVRSIMA